MIELYVIDCALPALGVMPIGQRYRATVTIDGVVHRFGMFDDPHHAHAIVSEFRNKNMPFAIESGP